jgi:hypothetical protein
MHYSHFHDHEASKRRTHCRAYDRGDDHLAPPQCHCIVACLIVNVNIFSSACMWPLTGVQVRTTGLNCAYLLKLVRKFAAHCRGLGILHYRQRRLKRIGEHQCCGWSNPQPDPDVWDRRRFWIRGYQNWHISNFFVLKSINNTDWIMNTQLDKDHSNS